MRTCITFGLLCLLIAGLPAPAASETQRWEFDGIDRIELDGTSGNVTVRPAEGNQLIVELESDVRPERNFRAEVGQHRTTLSIEEQWRGRRSRGRVEWTIHLPAGAEAPEFRFDTASGDLDCEDVTLGVRLDTASGDVRLRNVQLIDRSDFDTASGDYELEGMTISRDCRFDTASGQLDLRDLVIEDGVHFSTASGDVRAQGCRGYFELSSASGDVEIDGCQIESEGSFSTASGDVSLQLDRLPPGGLMASSASGDVRLDVGDFGDDFRLVLIKREDRGRISCPFEFTSESTFWEHHRYEEKIVERGSGEPEVELRTASGRVVVRD